MPLHMIDPKEISRLASQGERYADKRNAIELTAIAQAGKCTVCNKYRKGKRYLRSDAELATTGLDVLLCEQCVHDALLKLKEPTPLDYEELTEKFNAIASELAEKEARVAELEAEVDGLGRIAELINKAGAAQNKLDVTAETPADELSDFSEWVEEETE